MRYRVYNKIILVIIMTIVLVFNTNSICFGSNEDEKLITDDLELNSYSSSNNEMQYGCNIKKGEESIPLLIKAADFNLPPNLYDYKDDIRLRITYSQEDYKVHDCKIVNYHTNEIIEDISEENINKLFNIEYGKNVTKKEWGDTIKLSELKESEIYKYTASSTIQFPKIENDIGKNCIIYIKEKDEKNYEQKINMYKEISGNSVSASFNEYNSGETFSIMYREIKNEELLKKIQKDEIIYLSKYNDGDKLEYSFEKYIYNDTERNITIHIKDTAFGIEKSDSVTIEKGEIYGFDWMIDSAIINYANKNNQTEQKEESSQKDKETPKLNTDIDTKNTNEKNDTTLATGKLPKTGISMTIVFITIFTIIIAIICYNKYLSYRDIK